MQMQDSIYIYKLTLAVSLNVLNFCCFSDSLLRDRGGSLNSSSWDWTCSISLSHWEGETGVKGWVWQREREKRGIKTRHWDRDKACFVAVCRFYEGELQQLKGLHPARILNMKKTAVQLNALLQLCVCLQCCFFGFGFFAF